MGTVSSPALAVAVAEAGGLGSITAFGMAAPVLARMLSGMVTSTDGALAANFLTDGIDRDAVEVAATMVRVVDFFWSEPDPGMVDLVHRQGALACWQVGSAPAAEAAVAAGCDLVAVQGTEAGGHVWGDTPLLQLLATVVEAVDVPVLAAGGIADARTLAAVLAAGASGARVGTRFIASEESGAHPDYVDAVLAATGDATEITGTFSFECPLCAVMARTRVLRSSVTAAHALEADVAGVVERRDGEVPVPRFGPIPPSHRTRGHIEAMALYAGQGVGLVHRCAPAGEVLTELCDGAEHLLRRW